MKINYIGKDLAVIFLLFFLLLVFFWDAAALKGMFFAGDIGASDISELFYPLRQYTAEAVGEGRLPLWLPHIFCGFPLLADGTAGVLYPFYTLFYLFLPPFAAYNYSTIVHFFMAGLFTYLYARSIGLKRFSSVVSAIIFMFCGFFVTHLKHLSLIAASAWLPLNFFLAEMILMRKAALYAFFLAAALALQLFSGHFNFAFIVMLGTGVYFLFRTATEFKREPNIKKTVLPVLIFFSAIGLGLLLAAVQLLPTYELVKISSRAGGMALGQAVKNSFHPKDLITLIFPYFYGDPASATYKTSADQIFWEKCAYAGILPLLLVIFSAKKLWKEKYFSVFLGILLFFFLMAMGKNTPLFAFFFQFPGFNYFRIPSRYLLLIEFALAVLTGLSVEYWFYRSKISASVSKIKYLVLIFIILDLFSFGIRHNRVVSADQWLKKPDTVKFLEKDGGLYRIYSVGGFKSWPLINKLADGWRGDLSLYLKHREVLQQNNGILYGLFDVSGYSSLGVDCINNLLGYLEYRRIVFSNDGKWRKIFGLLNVKYFVAIEDLPAGGLDLKMQTSLEWPLKQVKIYENRDFMERAFIVPQAKTVLGEAKILEEMGRFDPFRTVIVEKELDWGSQSTAGSKVAISSYLPQTVDLEVALSGRGFLVLSDTYYPGWKVFVDGRESEILRANYIMRAVALDSGHHKVKFAYDPWSYKLGLYVSGIFSLITAAGIAVCLLKKGDK